MRRMKTAPVLVAFFFAPPAFAQELPATALAATRADVAHATIAQRCQAELDALFGAGDFPGASVGMVLPDGHELTFVVGFADRDRETPMTAEHRMLWDCDTHGPEERPDPSLPR